MSNACRIPVICYLLAAFPEGMAQKDEQGMTALDYAQHPCHPHSSLIIREFERGQPFWAAKDWQDPSANGVFRLLTEKNWDGILERLQKYPEESTMWTLYKNMRMLPIHYACKYRAPNHIIAELTEAYPRGLELTCQEHNMAALHLACENGCPLEAIWVLLDGNED